jgi:hypothetical protein
VLYFNKEVKERSWNFSDLAPSLLLNRMRFGLLIHIRSLLLFAMLFSILHFKRENVTLQDNGFSIGVQNVKQQNKRHAESI